MNIGRKKSPANHIAWINLVYDNTTHCINVFHSEAHKSYTPTPTTQMTVPGLWSPPLQNLLTHSWISCRPGDYIVSFTNKFSSTSPCCSGALAWTEQMITQIGYSAYLPKIVVTDMRNSLTIQMRMLLTVHWNLIGTPFAATFVVIRPISQRGNDSRNN